LTGGNGGDGGAGSQGGNGGSGGTGALFTNVTGPTVVLAAPVTGGNGGLVQSNAPLAGGGGIGAQFNGIGSNVTNSNTTKGGNGAIGSNSFGGAVGSDGGSGGMGMLFTAATATLTNTGTVTGGNGAAGGGGGPLDLLSGNGGAGGAGVTFAAGGTFTNGGSVTGGNGGIAGSIMPGFPGIPGTNGAAGAGVVGANLTVVNSGSITGGTTGGVQANAITFTGGTNSLELRAGSAITGNVVAFSTADTFILGGSVNASIDASKIGTQYLGFGAFDKTGTSTWTLTGATAAAAPWTINGGTLALSGTGSIAQSSLVTVGAGSAATFDISGTTSGASIIGLAGDSNGIVTLGSKTLTITNASSGNQYFGAINGSGGLTVTGGGQVLGGTSGYTGVTTINSGASLGLLGAGSIASSSKVIDNGALDLSVTNVNSSIKSLAGTNTNANVFLSNFSLTLTAANDTYMGMISGNGGLTLAAGTETLLMGSIGYSGATTINGGTLVVDTSLASTSGVAVNTGGTLAGTGIVNNVSIAGGTFAPGSGTPGSSMTVIGLLGFTAASTYAVDINATTSSFAHVTGAASLGGATVNATFAGGSYVSKQYTILTAGSVSGTFGSVVNTNLPANFRSTLSYDAKDAYLNLTLNYTPPVAPAAPSAPSFGGALNVNQQNVANALTNFFNTTGGIPLAFGALTPVGLSQVSGEAATGVQQTTFDAMNLFMGVMTDPFANGRADGGASGAGAATGYASTQNSGAAHDAYAMFTKAPPVAPFEQRWSTWVAGFGGSQSTDGNATLGSNNTTSSVYGTAVGADYRISPYTIAGFALAGGGTNFSVANSGSGHSDLFQAGAYIRHAVGAAYVSAALAYGWQDITTDRTVTAAGASQLRAQFDANAFSGRLEGGYRLVAPWVGGVGITPYAAAQFTTFDLPAYAEQPLVGSNAFALGYGAKDVTDTRSELGIRTDKSWAMTDGILTLRGRLAWAHDYDPDRSIGATFQTLPGASFVVNGAAQAFDSALVTASVEKKWINGWSAAATFEGEFSDVTRSYAGKGVVRYQW
jgi:uncharacterized protein with beta-barrel porin domain